MAQKSQTRLKNDISKKREPMYKLNTFMSEFKKSSST